MDLWYTELLIICIAIDSATCSMMAPAGPVFRIDDGLKSHFTVNKDKSFNVNPYSTEVGLSLLRCVWNCSNDSQCKGYSYRFVVLPSEEFELTANSLGAHIETHEKLILRTFS